MIIYLYLSSVFLISALLYKFCNIRKMWFVVDVTRGFFFFLMFLGFLILFGYYESTQFYDFRSVKRCDSNNLSVNYEKCYMSQKLLKNNSALQFVYIWNPDEKLKRTFKTGRATFKENKCNYTNCYITFDENYLRDLKDYNAIIFSTDYGVHGKNRPEHNNEYKQKFIFASFEPENSISMIDKKFDNYFNWTWTYRLDSDILWRHFIVHDRLGNEIGPREDMLWSIFNKNPEISDKLVKISDKAVAWITSESKTDYSNDYVQQLNNSLHKYNLSVDVFHKCKHNKSKQLEIIEREYFFMLAMEKVKDKDFVNGDVLNAMQHLVVPIVKGGAIYSRFLPPDSYLRTVDYTTQELAKTIFYLTTHSNDYQDFYKWKSQYAYKDGSSEICNLCEALNDKNKISSPAHPQFRKWWYGGNRFNKRLFNIMDKIVKG